MSDQVPPVVASPEASALMAGLSPVRAGLTSEFIGKGDANYLCNAEERFAKTFPKGKERALIFAAFENLFGRRLTKTVVIRVQISEKAQVDFFVSHRLCRVGEGVV